MDENQVEKPKKPRTATKAPEPPESKSLDTAMKRSVSGILAETSLTNSSFGLFINVTAAIVMATAALASIYLTSAKNKAVGIPLSPTQAFPIVKYMQAPFSYEESTKPLAVSMKYVRAMYEVDPLDHIEVAAVDSANKMQSKERVKVSSKVAEILGYVIPGSDENIKVAKALEKSNSLYQEYTDCKCVKRFLVSDLMVTSPAGIPTLRVELVGRFVIFGVDGRKTLPAQDLGLKSIVLYLAHDIPALANTKSAGGGGEASISVINPENWYIVKSFYSTLSVTDYKKLQQVRLLEGGRRF